ncbi:DUF3037 domain-containing protein [Zhouia sp. PK063]|uniref:DUF3037 domain-containing protein n=1 Tax=Zhouia sp. PK063 TaxID=3373602 RepID=UPI00379073D9
MHEKYFYEYAVIRVLPKVEREEFINVGILLFCKQQKFLVVKYHFPQEKLALFHTELNGDQVEENLLSFQKIAQGAKTGGRIGEFDITSRFRWLTAVRSSCIQTSRPRSGFSSNLEDTLQHLYKDLVL